MYFGNVVELTTSDELFKHPLHPYTKSLLSAIPKPNPIEERTRERIIYQPQLVHDYSVDKPTMKEVIPGHFIYCNNKEFEEYRKALELLKGQANYCAKGKNHSIRNEKDEDLEIIIV